MVYNSELHAKPSDLIVFTHTCATGITTRLFMTAHGSQPCYFCSHGEDSSKTIDATSAFRT